MHLLLDLVEREYVTSWIPISRELQRIGRCPPKEYERSNVSHLRAAKNDAQLILDDLEWDKVYDFCERLHSHLASSVGYEWDDEYQETTSRTVVQSYIADELKRIFTEESLAFEFSDGKVSRRVESTPLT